MLLSGVPNIWDKHYDTCCVVCICVYKHTTPYAYTERDVCVCMVNKNPVRYWALGQIFTLQDCKCPFFFFFFLSLTWLLHKHNIAGEGLNQTKVHLAQHPVCQWPLWKRYFTTVTEWYCSQYVPVVSILVTPRTSLHSLIALGDVAQH